MRLHIKNILILCCSLFILTASNATTVVEADVSDYEAPQASVIPLSYDDLLEDDKKQVDCLAENIYHEAGAEPTKGKIAVAMVTLNRTKDSRFPDDVCSVVRHKVKSTCQFSWVCLRVKLKKDSQMYASAKAVALDVYLNYDNMQDVTHGAMWYHANYVNPRWKLKRITTIGNHIFYVEKPRKSIKPNT